MNLWNGILHLQKLLRIERIQISPKDLRLIQIFSTGILVAEQIFA